MRQFEKSTERRLEKIAEKRNLEQRKEVKDKRYHVIDDEYDDEDYQPRGNYEQKRKH
jgi:hypothetical protein